ncbi:mas-related G-protein coupled receptor member X1-like [Macrotis lagotis]|uniref:mas-related G-protein coupled receptor member X1-like n=1 Tax=Macrotis lagotis TaxID=92651 RepID=UPI003D6979BB
MTVSPTPEQWEYVHYSETERSENRTFIPGTASLEKFTFGEWMLIPSLVIALVGLVGNGLVLWLLGFRIKRNPFSVYILNLAGADTLFLCCHFVFYIVYFLKHFYYNGIIEMYILKNMFYVMGLSLLAAISTERCLSVLFPIWYRCNRPRHMSAMVCTVLWTVATLLGVAEFVLCFNVYSYGFCLKYFITVSVWFLIFTPVMGLSSLTLLLRVQCTSGRRQPHRLYLLVLLNVLVFLLCGLPMGIMNFLSFWHESVMPFWLLHLLACVNSSVNPFIYFFLGRQRHRRRKESFRVVLQRALGDEHEVGSGERNNPHTNSPETSC